VTGGGVVDDGISNGTVSEIWANRTPAGLTKDACIQYGGRVDNGIFFPATIDGNCTNGSPVVFGPGKHANPASRLDFDPFNAAELNGRDLPTDYAPAADFDGVVLPADSGFADEASGQKFIVTREALTGTDLTKMENYVA
jgi:hypothetical protein